MPRKQRLDLSLQFDFKATTVLDSFDILDYTQEIKESIAQLIRDRLWAEDRHLKLEIESICFAAGSGPCGCANPPPETGRVRNAVTLHRDCPQHGVRARPDIWDGLPTVEHVITATVWNGKRA